ncbi:MAG: hypothetical protein GKR95_14565 [Gammaproteobacteria bacterium]|nr:hypothetical protein [Gammaproteobacteria bacterium]
MNRTRLLFYTLFPITCFYVFVYPVARLFHWLNPQANFGLLEMLVLWGVSILALWYSFSGPKIVIRYIVVHWMGISSVFATLTLVTEGLRLVVPTSDLVLGYGVMITATLAVIGAIAFSHHLSVKKHKISSEKLERSYRIAQISDVHIGSRQEGFMGRIVSKLNALEPDFVVITGDLIDSSAVGYQALSSLRELEAKTYFCIGNHERYADLEKILDIAKRLGLTTLRQNCVRENELMFLGVDDADRPDQLKINLPLMDLDSASYQVLLYHRPRGWRDARAHGIDLMLSGHTHNGQIFPFNLLVKQQFKRIRGMFVEGESRLYVSSGTGTWGPLMRLGSMNEISVFDLIPKRKTTQGSST